MATAIRFTENNAFRIALLALPAVVWCIDFNAHDDFSFCLFRLLLDRHCYGCGTLRGASALLHLEWGTALKLNPMNGATLPLLGWIYMDAWRKYRI